ncbi:MAG: 16S rRNA (guanine(966)-N(2))-methyltransferase RsmD [Coriobacteriales bacterium]|jgi:16S rRNA (guanine966-N2)-methyltransferase|nr:16S rRNA (guanine(966)-N(2))-methyltransferase RsmD [Coriobacteriales bacterium]
MRIIAGDFRGRKLQAAAGQVTRPTTDRIREAWASSINSLLHAGLSETIVLDAFAGSGALGLEALSRGAARCLFVEKERRAFNALKSNVQALLGVGSQRGQLLCADVLSATTLAAVAGGGPYDLVVLDPPYGLPVGSILELLSRLARVGALATGAVISLERRKADEDVLDGQVLCRACSPASLHLVSSKAYGGIQIRYYRFA